MGSCCCKSADEDSNAGENEPLLPGGPSTTIDEDEEENSTLNRTKYSSISTNGEQGRASAIIDNFNRKIIDVHATNKITAKQFGRREEYYKRVMAHMPFPIMRPKKMFPSVADPVAVIQAPLCPRSDLNLILEASEDIFDALDDIRPPHGDSQ